MGDNDSDIYATDKEEGPSSLAIVTVVARKRPATARSHASRPRPPRASKRAKRTTAAGGRTGAPSTAGNCAQVKHIDGECAPFNDKSAYIDDPINHRTFLLGGIKYGDYNEYPTSDFYCCDTMSMTWKNLTNSLTFRTPTDPFATAEIHPKKTSLPQLSFPGSALVRVAEKSFIFIFGGYDPGANAPTSSVIVVDPDALTWWYLNIEGEGVSPRINPTAASVGNEVFVFGGYKRFGNDCGPCSSYNVLSYTPGTGTWQWKTRDKPYPKLVAANHAFGAAIPVYEGEKILLLPGRHTEDDKITFTPTNIFYYHIDNDNFQSATRDFSGKFPQSMYWYYAYEYREPTAVPPPPNSHSAYLNDSANTSPSALRQTSIASPNGKRPRGRKDQGASRRIAHPVTVSASATNANSTPHNQNPYSSRTSPSVIICGWNDSDCGSFLVPELWHLFLNPKDRIICLNMAKCIWDLNHDFQLFFCVEGQLRLLGRPGDEGNGQDANQAIRCFDTYVDLLY